MERKSEAVAMIWDTLDRFSGKVKSPEVRRCRVCGCTDDDCRQCIEKTGYPCHWVAEDLCSACADETDGEPDFDNEDGGFIYDDEYEEDEDYESSDYYDDDDFDEEYPYEDDD